MDGKNEIAALELSTHRSNVLLDSLHRDIKSENILLTEELNPRVADLGEARVLAQNHTMTVVGTNGYTAPEVLEGRHYGTPADVYSFAIVMSEVVTLRPPFKDMMFDEDGHSVASWGQIVAMTKSAGLRPSLPCELDPEMESLIRDCWDPNPQLRPNFVVIFERLRTLAQANRQYSSDRLSSRSFDSLLESRNRQMGMELCRQLYDLMWSYKQGQWNRRLAKALVKRNATIEAADPVLNEIVKGEQGASALKQAAKLMIGGVEDGAEVRPEPLTNEDMIVNDKGRSRAEQEPTLIVR